MAESSETNKNSHLDAKSSMPPDTLSELEGMENQAAAARGVVSKESHEDGGDVLYANFHTPESPLAQEAQELRSQLRQLSPDQQQAYNARLLEARKALGPGEVLQPSEIVRIGKETLGVTEGNAAEAKSSEPEKSAEAKSTRGKEREQKTENTPQKMIEVASAIAQLPKDKQAEWAKRIDSILAAQDADEPHPRATIIAEGQKFLEAQGQIAPGWQELDDGVIAPDGRMITAAREHRVGVIQNRDENGKNVTPGNKNELNQQRYLSKDLSLSEYLQATTDLSDRDRQRIVERIEQAQEPIDASEMPLKEGDAPDDYPQITRAEVLPEEQAQQTEAKTPEAEQAEMVGLAQDQIDLTTKDPEQMKKLIAAGKQDKDNPDFTQQRWGLEPTEKAARLTNRDQLSSHQKGALTAEQHRLSKYVADEVADGNDVPIDILARLQDLNFVLDNAKRQEPGIEAGRAGFEWHLPKAVTERVEIPIAQEGPDGTTETPTGGGVEVVDPAQGGPGAGPQDSGGENNGGGENGGENGGGERPGPFGPEGPPEVMTLIVQDSEATDKAMSILEGENQTTDRINELRERWAGSEVPTGSKVAEITKLVGRAIRHLPSFINYTVQSNLMRQGVRQRYIVEAHQEKTGIDYHVMLADQVARRVDVGDPMFGENLLQQDTPEVQAVKQQLNDVFVRGVRGDMDRNAVVEQAKAIAAAAPWIRNGSEQAIHIVQNIERIYDHVAARVDHDAGIEAINAAYKLVGGETTLGVNTETQRTVTDRVMEKLTNSRLKSLLVNEATVALVVGGTIGIVSRIGRSTAGKVAGVALGGLVTGGALPALVGAAASAGVFAGLKEGMTLRQERAGLAAELAMGGARVEGRSGVPRRAQLEETIYDSVGASDVLNQFDAFDLSNPEDLTADQADLLFNRTAALTANIRLGVEGQMDLIGYSSPDSVEAEKTNILVARAQAITALRAYTSAHPDAFADLEGNSFDDKLNTMVERSIQSLQQGEIADKDRVYRKASRSAKFKKGFAAAASVVVATGLIQKAREYFAANPAYAETPPQPLPNQHAQYGFKGDSLNMPKDWHLEGNAIIDGNGNHIADNIKLTDDWRNWGALPPETIQQIKDHGFDVKAGTSLYEHTVDRTMSYPDYLAAHPEKVQDISRDLWLNNNTARFDLNELRGDYRLDANGNIILSTQRLTNDGSFWKNVAVEAHNDQVKGHLKWVLSNQVDQYTGKAQILDIPPNGEVLLPKGSPEYNLFKILPDGSVHNNGSWAEIAVDSGKPHPGGERGLFILATQGENGPTPAVTFTDHVKFPVTETTIIAYPPNVPVPPPDIFTIPLEGPLPRKPVENLIPREPDIIIPPYYYGGGEVTEDDRRRWSERIRNNPDAVLDVYEEVDDYFSRIPASEVALATAQDQQIGEPMNEDCHTVITIPVAGHQEGKNIYNTLTWYTGQKGFDGGALDSNSFEVVLYVNKPSDVDWDETPAEIQRFVADHPDFPLRVVQREFAPGEFTIGRARRELLNVVLRRQHERGAANNDINIVSHDADLKGIGETYVATLNRDFENQQTDGMSGRLDWGPEALIASPLFGMGVKLSQAADGTARHPRPGDNYRPSYSYSGNNFAFRASMYAAIGGYREDIGLAEDINLGANIAAARSGGRKRPIGFSGGDNVVYTSPRRQIVAYNHGASPAEAWSQVRWSEFDDEVRAQDVVPQDQAELNYDLILSDDDTAERAAERRRFLDRLEDMTERTLVERHMLDGVTYSDPREVEPFGVARTKRILRDLRIEGASVMVIDGRPRVRIASADRMFDYLRRFKVAGRRAYEARTGVNGLFSGGINTIFPEFTTAS